MSDRRITRFRQSAEKLIKQIEHARRPMTQNLPPKRNREYRKRLWEADNMERHRRALLALADALEHNTCPVELAKVKNASDVAHLVYKGTLGGGYYDWITNPAFRDTSPAGRAMQSLLERPPIHTPDKSSHDAPPNDLRSTLDADRIARDLDAQEADCRLTRIPGFFPTPPRVADRMAELAGIQPFERVLEPSAGSGRLIDAALAAQPDCDVDACEYYDVLRRLLTTKQQLIPFDLVGDDFTTYLVADAAGQPAPTYDVIMMNPPFEKAADIRHVMHAFTHHLRPGGRLVAIVSSGALYRTDRTAQAFRALVNEWSDNPDGIPLPSGTFEDTGVSAVILELHKPAIDEPYVHLFPCAISHA